MSTLDDLPLDAGPETDIVTAPSAPSSPGPRVVFFAVLALTLAAAAWVFMSRSQPAPAAAPQTTATAPPALVAAEAGAEAPVALPPLAQMDPLIRSLLSALSAQPALLRWLATDDLVGAMATAIARLAAGESPARDLAALRPGEGFATVRRGGATLVDPSSYRRYDALVSAVTTIDATKLAAAFTTLKPRLVEAFAAQGHDAAAFDQALARALFVVISTPEASVDAPLMPGVGVFGYADPALERLPGAQRHLLRMGPSHVRAVRDATRRFAEALGITPVRS